MVGSQKIPWFAFVIAVAAAVFVFPLPVSFAQSDAARPILRIDSLSAGNGSVSGTAVLKNSASQVINGLSLTYILQERNKETSTIENGVETTVVTAGAAIASQTGKDFFSLLPGEEKKFDFSLRYPPSIPAGTYRLEARAVGISGAIANFALSEVELKGNGGAFLKIDQSSCALAAGRFRFQPDDGPNIFPDEKFAISCSVSNLSAERVDALPVLGTATFFAVGFPQTSLQNTDLPVVHFLSHETRNIAFDISSAGESPQVYQGALQFRDPRSRDVISPVAFFRWIVKGEAARIDSVKLDKDRYQAGEKARVNVRLWISPDLFWTNVRLSPSYLAFVKADPERFAGSPVLHPVLKITLSSGRGDACGASQKSFDKPFDAVALVAQEIEVALLKNCPDPKAGVIFMDGSKVLASIDYPTRSLPAPGGAYRIYYLWLIGLAIVIGLCFFFWYKYKKKSYDQPQ